MSHVQSLEISSSKKNSSAIWRKIVTNLLKFGVTAGILYYLYSKGMLDFTRVRAVLTNVPIVSVSIALLMSTTSASVVRWWLLLEGQGLKVPILEALRLTMIGVFFNTALPGAVSGDLVKGYYVVRQQPDGRGRIRAFTTLLLDRLLGLSALICVSFVAMAMNYKAVLASPTLKHLASLISMLWMGVVVFYAFVLIEWPFSKKLLALLHRLPAGEHLAKLYEAVKAYESCKHYVLKGLLISMMIHGISIGVFILLARALGGFDNVSIDQFYFLAPFGLLVTAIPIAPAGLGTGHAAFAWLFQLVGARGGADLFTAYVSFQIFISLVGGLFYVRYRGHLPKAG
jgi:uncharacterized protein (TIRG00374 family)